MPPQSSDNEGLKQNQLTRQILTTCLDFIGKWIPIFRRTTFYDIGDKNIVSCPTNRCQHFIKKFSCSTDKRHTQFILAFTWSFTDKNYFCLRITYPGDSIGTSFTKSTWPTHFDLFSNFAFVKDVPMLSPG